MGWEVAFCWFSFLVFLPILGAENVTLRIFIILPKHCSFSEPVGGGDGKEAANLLKSFTTSSRAGVGQRRGRG